MDSVYEKRKIEEYEEEKKSLHSDDVKKYTDIISTLPKRNCWETTIYQYKGFWYPHGYVLGMLLSQHNFKPQPNDIILCSFPKSGTTWLKALASAIVTRSDLSTFPHDCVPFIEVDEIPSPRIPLVASHSSYSSLPPSIAGSGCKIVYICRDPKDVLVSFWYFLKKFTYVNPENYPSLEQGFELFCQGVISAGPFWEHVLEYWKASLEFPDRVLFLVYEDMKKDTVSVVKKLAEFMRYPFSMEEERQGLVQKIVKSCSFEALSNLDVTKNGEQWSNSEFAIPKSSFFRKAEVGDWKNHLTPEMADRLDQITQEKLSASGLWSVGMHFWRKKKEIQRKEAKSKAGSKRIEEVLEARSIARIVHHLARIVQPPDLWAEAFEDSCTIRASLDKLSCTDRAMAYSRDSEN